MQRGGRRHVNYFRINAIEKRVKRDGQVLENLGWYNPQAKDKAKQVELNIDRIKHWLSVGAQPSDTVLHLLIKANLVEGKEWQDRLAARIEAVKKAEANKAANPQGAKKEGGEKKPEAKEEKKA
jgi:small subunit ribosomal protein S16